MFIDMKPSFKKRMQYPAFAVMAVAALIAGGYFMGRIAGNRLVEGILLRETRLPLLLSRPVYQFYDIYTLLNSQNPYSRLSGYYSLLDANMIDPDFIRERYDREEVPVIRKTLLWVLSFSRDRDAALRFYASRYDSADEDMKKEIASMMERLDPAFYREFIRKKRAPVRAGKGA